MIKIGIFNEGEQRDGSVLKAMPFGKRGQILTVEAGSENLVSITEGQDHQAGDTGIMLFNQGRWHFTKTQ